jgi:hypothetical protein
MLKQCVERDAGFKSAEAKLYVHDDSREEALENGETLGSLCRWNGLAAGSTDYADGAYLPDEQEAVAELAGRAR